MKQVSSLREIVSEITSRRAPQTIAIGLICGLVTTVFSLSYAALLFSGGLSGSVDVGLGVMLVSSAVMAIVGALLTSYAPIYSQVRDIPLAYLALVAPGIGVAAGTAAVPTVVALVAVTTLLLGLSLFLVGYFRLGRVIRFIPFPVISGFLAGVAWLIVSGAFTILTGEPFTLASFAGFIALENVPEILTALAFVTATVVGRRWLPAGILMPLLVVVATLLFHAVVGFVKIDRATLVTDGWLAELPAHGSLWPPVDAAGIAAIDWALVLANWPTVVVIILVTMVALLLNVSGLEIEVRRDIDLDAELKTAGASNLLAGALGGAPGYQSLSMTVLSQRLGGGSRGTSFIAGLFLIGVLLFGSAAIGVVPLPVLAAIVLATGATLLYERLVLSYRTLPIGEYVIVLGIFLTTVALGFLTAVVFGVLAAMTLFVFEYSRAGVVKFEVSGRDFQSGAASSEHHRKLLREHGDAILIMRLQGFLFFGTANGLRRAIEARFRPAEGNPVRFVLLDFRRISGIDSAAVQSFVRLAETARDRAATVVLANVSNAAGRILVRGGLPIGPGSPVVLAETFEKGLSDCEHAIISEVDPDLAVRKPQPLGDQLRAFADAPAEIEKIAALMERLQVEPAATILEHGSAATEMFFIEAGTASVRLPTDGQYLTLATVGPGSIVGEIAFYLGSIRTAFVIAETPMVIWRFSRDALAELEADSPAAAARFHRGMAEVLADRLSATNRLVRFLAT
ncbi:MAG: SLC26A/SulP transporter family protein [Bauldia sp.]|nr:SLC26A/SulP transporter family protein [Bauldia sp.]